LNTVYIVIELLLLDSEVERAAILVKVIPEIRSIFASRGYELYYHDCHLGTSGITDDHNIERICINTLNTSIEKWNMISQDGIRFMVCWIQVEGLI
jgi:hypothetical protein